MEDLEFGPLSSPIDLLEDLHTHSTFSDGRGTLEENLARAASLGLRRLGCVDHVRRDTDWLPAFVRSVDALRRDAPLEIVLGVEAKLLDESGRLDAPPDLGGVDRVYVADHRLPLGDRCLGLSEARRAIRSGELNNRRIIDALIGATRRAMEQTPRVVIAHLFSLLPKLGISEDDVPIEQIRSLAVTARQAGAWLELDERWRCPGTRTARVFLEAGVPVVASSDAHRVQHIGAYRWLPGVAGELKAATCSG